MREESALQQRTNQPSLAPHRIESISGAVLNVNPALSLPGLIHDARNLVTTLDLYCDLIDAPGVLSSGCGHYAQELRQIAGRSRRILEKLAATESTGDPRNGGQTTSSLHRNSTVAALTFTAAPIPSAEIMQESASSQTGTDAVESRKERPVACPPGSTALSQNSGRFQRISDTVENFCQGARWSPFMSTQPITSLDQEVLANHNLLSALAGPGITVGLSLYGGKRPIAMSCDDLTRILINLTKNAVEAMPQGGHIQIALEEFSDRLCLSISDTGCGLPESTLEDIFTSGYTSHVHLQSPAGHPAGWMAPHRGLGLAIVRSIVSAAGGTVTAANRGDLDTGLPSLPGAQETPVCGAIFRLNFPVAS